jgi:hypothetical protein
MFLFSVRPRPAPQAPDFPSHFQRQVISAAGSESIVYIGFFDSNSKSRTESWDSGLTEYQERRMLRRSTWTIGG